MSKFVQCSFCKKLFYRYSLSYGLCAHCLMRLVPNVEFFGAIVELMTLIRERLDKDEEMRYYWVVAEALSRYPATKRFDAIRTGDDNYSVHFLTWRDIFRLILNKAKYSLEEFLWLKQNCSTPHH